MLSGFPLCLNLHLPAILFFLGMGKNFSGTRVNQTLSLPDGKIPVIEHVISLVTIHKMVSQSHCFVFSSN
jgi:hypothetical protein